MERNKVIASLIQVSLFFVGIYMVPRYVLDDLAGSLVVSSFAFLCGTLYEYAGIYRRTGKIQ